MKTTIQLMEAILNQLQGEQSIASTAIKKNQSTKISTIESDEKAQF